MVAIPFLSSPFTSPFKYMKLLSFFLFLAIVYNCICIDVFVDLLLMLITSSNHIYMPFLYSSSVKGNTSEESSSLIGDNLGHLGVVGISPRLLKSSCCATWLAVTRQCDFEAVGSIEIFLIVCHAFRMFPVRSVDIINSLHLRFQIQIL